MKRLYNIKRTGEQFDGLREISVDEEVVLVSAFKLLGKFTMLHSKFNTVVAVHEELIKGITTNSPGLDRLLSEYLSSFSSFLNQWESYLKTTFGNNSTNIKLFQQAKSLEYDNHFAYRFLYELRNYIHHCGFPNISLSGRLLDNEEKEYSLLIDVIDLQSGFKWKPVLKHDISLRGSNLEIFHSFTELLNCLSRINNVALNTSFNIKDLYVACESVLPYKKLLKGDDYELAIVEYTEWYDSHSPKKMNVSLFPFNAAEHLINGITTSETL